jgi:hypothetical protein
VGAEEEDCTGAGGAVDELVVVAVAEGAVAEGASPRGALEGEDSEWARWRVRFMCKPGVERGVRGGQGTKRGQGEVLHTEKCERKAFAKSWGEDGGFGGRGEGCAFLKDRAG